MKTGRILIVDDEESIRSTLGDYFSSIGYDVVTAQNGEEALKKFSPRAFDCIISDLFMPEINGMELLKRVRLMDGDVFFLMITAYPMIDSAINAMKEGAYDYITKPFHMEDIKMKVERALSVKKTEASLKKVRGLFLSLIILIPVVAGLVILLLLK
ncbi:MAG: hypothetical protein C0390_14085 [Syntrophus sp. (in: bacteria)]|nr:hypothetical protein [Syntrophus sp. (in: bacteria)]